MAAKIDIFDKHDQPTVKTATFEEVRGQGLWHRGVHVIIYTPERQIVMQKRSGNLDYHPNEIEVSVGGGVDSGETPPEAAVREIREELGLKVDVEKLEFISVKTYNHRYRYGSGYRYIRTHDYAYKLEVPRSFLDAMKPEQDEVSNIYIWPKRRVMWMIRRNNLKKFGRMVPRYAYWSYLVKSIG